MTPEEVAKDAEGMFVMRTLGRNMAWLLHSIEAGKAAGITQPKQEQFKR
ncbi:MAG: NADPH-dependent FMN reductase domain protein [Desulfotomaculum sp. 46_80]|nr:MAG: NADPH-dependent FMN reductase domain protein [Desulfotomaculum sp. 46_80]